MEIILSAAVSLDGCLDDCSPERLKLSSAEDWSAVEELRAECDAILVGAGTVRKDNPSLVIKREELRARRVAAGLTPDITKVTVTRSGDMNPESKFFTAGAGRKIVITEHDAAERLHVALGDRAEIVAVKHISARHIIEALAKIGVRKLMVEGGSMVLSMFVSVRMFDSFRLAVAPFFVGEDAAPRLRADVGIDNLHLTYAESLGGMAVLHYDALRSTLTDAEYMRMAVDESRKCVPSCTSYSVGAVIVTKDNQLFTGYTHETGDKNHAEEEAMMKAEAAGADLHGAAIYCSMEPCSQRHSKPVSCSALIINHKMGKVFYALEEPANFVDCEGAQLLRKAGIKTMHLDGFEGEVVAINGHILK